MKFNYDFHKLWLEKFIIELQNTPKYGNNILSFVYTVVFTHTYEGNPFIHLLLSLWIIHEEVEILTFICDDNEFFPCWMS